MTNRTSLLLKNGLVVSTNHEITTDLLLQDGRIAALGNNLSPNEYTEVIDVSGKYILPGVIDAHVHLREFEHSAREDFFTGTQAAAIGGVTTVLDMPNSNPKVITPDKFVERRNRVMERAYVNIGLYVWAYGGNVDILEEFVSLGAVGYKIFTAETGIYSEFQNFTTTEPDVLFRILEQVGSFGGLVAIHSESQAIMTYLEQRAKEKLSPDMRAYLAARPSVVEDVAVFSEVAMAKHCATRVHICHVVGKNTVDFLRWAKKTYCSSVSCEVTPHNLLLSAEQCSAMGSVAKFSPPVHDATHRQALWEGLLDGTIDIVGSDHAPQDNVKKKDPNVWNAPPGSPALDYWVPLMLDKVARKEMSMRRFVEVTSERPAQIFGLFPRKGTIRIGADADLIVVDMNKTSRVDASRFKSKAKYSPFDGWQMRGLPVMTLVNGKIVARDGEIVGSPGTGKFVSPLKDAVAMGSPGGLDLAKPILQQ